MLSITRKLQKNARLFLAVLAVSGYAAAALVPAPASAADWVQDWFDQSAVTSPGSLHTQQRGYYTGGAFQARWRMSNDYPFSVSPPSFKAGCGGIDLFGGGFTFMDPEYLVQKLERAIQAAPAIAFSMAMSEYCKVCQTTMESLEQITDYLNSMQINDCRLAKGIAAIPVNGDTSIFDDTKEKAMQGYSILTGQTKNSEDVDQKVQSSGGKSPVDTSKMIAQCPAVFKTVFGGGSVVDNVTQLVSLNSYADLMRGMIGDVQITYDSTYNNYNVSSVEPCPGNDPVTGFDLLTGQIQKKAQGNSGACTQATSQSVQDQIASRLNSIATKLQVAGSGAAALSSDDMKFIAGAPFPILNMLRDAIKDGHLDETLASVSDVLAAAYAAEMLDDIHNMARIALLKADEVSRKASTTDSGGDPNQCSAPFLKDAFVQIRAMDSRAVQYRQLAKENWVKYQTALNANLSYAKLMLEQRRQSLGNNATSLK